jgi:tRNA A37 threonylcarbamoyladenosine dehydratase
MRSGETDELYEEQVSRNTAFFGQEGQDAVRDSFVVVVGLGGVGSHCAHMIARAGVRRIRIIDFDQVTLSSLNRHAVATREDVGISKAAALKKRLLAIVPWCEIDDRNVMFEEACAETLLAGEPDYVADCIDDVNTKVALLAICQKKGLKVISCMGAGAKSDPSRLQIGDLNDATRDPLCAKVRYMLKKRQGRQNGKKNQMADSSGMMVVYSSEKPTRSLLPLSAEQTKEPQQFGALEHFRIRTIPVLGTMPALMGQAQASYLLCDLAGQAFQAECSERISKDLRNKLFNRLQNREKKKHNNTEPLDLDKDDIDHIVSEVWRNRSAISGTRVGGTIR